MDMNAAVLEEHQHLVYKRVPVPTLRAGEVCIAVKYCGVCGTDIHIVYDGSLRYPHIPGHELTGVVVAAADSEGVALVGKEVTAYGIVGCGKCEHCLNGDYSKCQAFTFIGAGRDGAFAEYANYPARNVIPLDGIPLRSGVLIEPIAVAVHAARLLRDIPRAAVVVGTGPIGLLAAQVLRAMGTEHILVVGFGGRKEALVHEMGFESADCTMDSVSDKLTAMGYPDGAPAVLECSGRVPGLNCALTAAKPGGDVVLVGMFGSDVVLEAGACHRILRRELRVSGSWISNHDPDRPDSDWHAAMNMLRDGKIDAERIMTGEVALRDVPDALEALHGTRTANIKTVVRI